VDYEILGQILKDARSKEKFTQSEIATRLGVTFQNVSSWERGKSKIDIDTLSKLCSLYNINFVSVLERASNGKDHSAPTISKNETLNHQEKEIIKKYRQLDLRGQQAVQDTLNREYAYINNNSSANIAALAVDAVNTIDKISEEMAINQKDYTNKK